MKLNLYINNSYLGEMKLEGTDPSMGIIHGRLFPIDETLVSTGQITATFINTETGAEINCESIYLENNSEIMHETWIDVTATLDSSDEFRKHFE
jgi:hypothetical protein